MHFLVLPLAIIKLQSQTIFQNSLFSGPGFCFLLPSTSSSSTFPACLLQFDILRLYYLSL